MWLFIYLLYRFFFLSLSYGCVLDGCTINLFVHSFKHIMVTIVCFRSVLVFLAFIPELCLGSCGSLRFISSVLLALLVWTFDVYALAKIAKKSCTHKG